MASQSRGRTALRRSGRIGTAGIIAAVLLFAMLFTIGTGFFIFANSENQSYDKTFMSNTNMKQESLNEVLAVTPLLSGGHLAFYLNNTGGVNSNVTGAFVLDSSGNVLQCDGVGLPIGTCGNSTPALPVAVNVGEGSPVIDTGYTYVSGTVTLKVVTNMGSIFSAVYPVQLPSYALQAESSGSLTVDLSTFKWIQPTGDQQTGALVGGFPANSVPTSAPSVIFEVTFTNHDPQGRGVTLWPDSSVSAITVYDQTNGKNIQVTNFYIVDGLNNANDPTGVIAYNSTKPFIHLPANVPTAIYFASTYPRGSTTDAISNLNLAPYEALFSLTGQYDDKTPYAQTIPFPTGIVTSASASLSAYSGNTNAVITASGSGFGSTTRGMVAWLNPTTNAMTSVATFTTTSGGDVSVNFNVPNVPTGYYIVDVTDYVNSYYVVFYHT